MHSAHCTWSPPPRGFLLIGASRVGLVDNLSRREVRFDYDDLERLRGEFALSRIPHAKFSALFVSQLYLFDRFGPISVDTIVNTVRGLHGAGPSRQTKGPLQFRHPPLKGLWHVHFFEAHHVPENLRQQWRRSVDGKPWLERAIDAACDASGERVFTRQLLRDLARVAVEGALVDREAAGHLTGEWIVYAVHADVHYYLTVASHQEADAEIHRRICKVASVEFPFLDLGPAA